MPLITLADAKTHLNIPASAGTTYDAELQGFCDATVQVGEDIAGVILPRTITGEVHHGGVDRLALRVVPIISIQSVTEYIGINAKVLTSQPLGSTTDNYGYELIDANGGIILRRSSSGVPIPFLAARNGVVVSYTAGYNAVPAAARLGALDLVRHWWDRSQQGFDAADGSASDDQPVMVVNGYPVSAFAFALFSSLTTSPHRTFVIA